jgi:hypothetical protein
MKKRHQGRIWRSERKAHNAGPIAISDSSFLDRLEARG